MSLRGRRESGPRSPLHRLLGHYDAVTRTFSIGLVLAVLLPLVPVALLLRFSGIDFPASVGFAGSGIILVASLVLYSGFLESFRVAVSRRRFLDEWRGMTSFLVILLATAIGAHIVAGEEALEAVFACGLLFIAMHRGLHALLHLRLFAGRPSLVLGTSFAIIIVLGTFFLWLSPRALQEDRELSLVDALFTATSATCVTGLEAVSTVETFTPFGQSIVLLLIQIGGLGIMTLGTFLVLSSGHRFGLSDRALVSASMNLDGIDGLAKLLTGILSFTLFFEFIGALLFLPFHLGGEEPLFRSVFHSVSAFCNAGFALDAASFGPHVSNLGFNLVAMALIIAGGLGFTVLAEIAGRLRARIAGERRHPISLQTRLVLGSSAVLIVIGALAFYLIERNGVLAGRGAGESILASFFQSVSARTAGFATVPFGGEDGLSGPGRFLLLPFMLIGASPGSTGGGIKTVTIMLLLLAILSELRRRRSTEAFGRTVPDGLVKQAAAVVVIYLFTLFVALLALLISEGGRFGLDELIFETVSAIGTVGFSVGISSSPELSDFGKFVFIGLMFAGRVGPLTLILFAASNRKSPAIEYPEERVIIG